jgi:hypothetical protein
LLSQEFKDVCWTKEMNEEHWAFLDNFTWDFVSCLPGLLFEIKLYCVPQLLQGSIGCLRKQE